MRSVTLTIASALALVALTGSARAASVSLTPSIASPGATVSAQGAGWRAGTGVTIRRRGGAVLGRGLVGGDGRFAVALRVPRNLAARSHPVQVLGAAIGTRRGSTTTLTGRLRVVAGVREWAPRDVAVSGGVRLALSRTVAFPTAPVRVDAFGLRPGATLAARLTGGETVRARADRRGRASLSLVVSDLRLESSALVVRSGRLRRVERFYVVPPQTVVPPLPPPTREAPLVGAAGDVACFPGEPRTALRCHHAETAELLASAQPDAVAMLGDAQYDIGSPEEFAEYDRTWGRVKPLTRPAVGNHEYGTAFAAGYFGYFGAAAGAPDRGYYSYDLGAWHVVVLNSNCSRVGCGRDSRQERWLRADLAAHPDRCTLAYWHHPRHSSAQRSRENTSVQALWAALVEGGADLALTGHVHNYERIAPLDAEGEVDYARGLRQFVVGTGGRNYQQLPVIKPYSEASNTDTFGVLLATLRPDGYDWRFAPEPGDDYTDSGSAPCH